ncbi:hypothetical protein JJ691_102570 [Kutzneria sp. CA-103260]|nr:hypothetical protein JJ691_102570 [Kutzneria sp. CA-103260]
MSATTAATAWFGTLLRWVAQQRACLPAVGPRGISPDSQTDYEGVAGSPVMKSTSLPR